MPLSALVMVIVVVSGLLPLCVVAIVWPAQVAQLNAAALRTMPVAAPRSMREQAATNSTPGVMRFNGVGGLVIVVIIGWNVARTVVEEGVQVTGSQTDPRMAWLIYALGIAQLIFGASVLLGSRRLFERFRTRFDQHGAPLSRWMFVVIGALGVAMGLTSLLVGLSLT